MIYKFNTEAEFNQFTANGMKSGDIYYVNGAVHFKSNNIDGKDTDYTSAGGSDITLENLDVTSNGTYNADENKGYSKVTVAVPQTELTNLIANSNDTYDAPEGKAYSSVLVEVPETTLTSRTIKSNGTYEAPEGLGYSTVIVNVPSPSYSQGVFTKNGEYAGIFDGVTVEVPIVNDISDYILFETISNSYKVYLKIKNNDGEYGYLHSFSNFINNFTAKEGSTSLTTDVDTCTFTVNSYGTHTITGSFKMFGYTYTFTGTCENDYTESKQEVE